MYVCLLYFRVAQPPREVNLDLHMLSWFLVSKSSGMFNPVESNIVKKLTLYLSINDNCSVEIRGSTAR